ncbi:DUF1523 family protein [Paracoccus sanguinis]|uniref:DUF1523 family protein n=1 Tax=Paracoccus sanguinis TaxID=1545044 RepID=A0A1H2S2Z5_9RHOB|nr:DUF1523 family protein [Paracoccus sanguinis]KGJ18643.1 hypothetical protein IX57_03270 [Paracoccus sanguinis]SDW25926.1 Protein of unknown function [Paracoccus sanguinis]
MRNLQVALGVIFGVLVFLFLDYALPSRHTVRVTNVYNQITDLGWNGIFYASPDTGTVQTADGRRDIRYIATVQPNGRPYVYRNEDTGWIWPPYFKYDSSNLHAIAADSVSTADAPRWMNVTSYGWRVSWATIYPNAISMRQVAGPGDRPLNWPALVILGVMGALLLLLWRMWNQFHERSIEPRTRRAGRVIEHIDARADAAQAEVVANTRKAAGRMRNWVDSWRGPRSR